MTDSWRSRCAGRPWSDHALGTRSGACKRAGLAGSRLHDMRHVFLTTLFKSGAPAPTVQMLAGHANLTITQRYAHAAAVDLRAMIDRLGVAELKKRVDKGRAVVQGARRFRNCLKTRSLLPGH